LPGDAPVVNCQSGGSDMRLLERLVCGLPASCCARTPGSPAMKTMGKSSTWMKAGYGVCGALAAQAESTSTIGRSAMTLVLIKKYLLSQQKKAAQKLGGY
jgi:hypothetical protein